MPDFWIFYFRIFKICQICLFWSKITIFIIEIILNYSRRFGLGCQKCYFLPSGSSKIHRTYKHSYTCHGLNFYRKDIFFLLLLTMSSIRINNSWKFHTYLCRCRPLKVNNCKLIDLVIRIQLTRAILMILFSNFLINSFIHIRMFLYLETYFLRVTVSLLCR